MNRSERRKQKRNQMQPLLKEAKSTIVRGTTGACAFAGANFKLLKSGALVVDTITEPTSQTSQPRLMTLYLDASDVEKLKKVLQCP